MAGHAKTLNPRQRIFVQAVAEGQPYTQAYKLAGYTAKDSARPAHLAKLPIVKAEIERLRARALANTEMSAVQWRAYAADYYSRALDAGDLANVGRALEINAKALGLFENTGTANEYAAAMLVKLDALMARQQAVVLLPERVITIESRVVQALGVGKP